MYQRNCYSFATFMLVAFIASTALAQENRFTQWDKNKDGKLIKAELPQPLQKNFDKVDTDSDGFITIKEHRAFLARGNNRANNQPAQRRQAQARPGIKIEKDIPYADTDEPAQRLDSLLPEKRSSDKPLPVVVFIHGGGWRNGSKASGIGKVAPFVASGDYAAASIEYRLSDKGQWPAQIHDCKAGIRWIKAHAEKYNLDADKIAVWGTSAGGHLVAMLGVTAGDKELDGTLGKHTDQTTDVACVLNFFGPSDLLTMNDKPSKMDHNAPNSPESLMVGGPIQENKAKANNASPLHHVTKDDAVFLTMHGTADPLVPYDQSVRFHAKLLKAGVDSTFVTILEGGHGFNGPEVDQRVSTFLEKHLRGKEGDVKTEEIELKPRAGK